MLTPLIPILALLNLIHGTQADPPTLESLATELSSVQTEMIVMKEEIKELNKLKKEVKELTIMNKLLQEHAEAGKRSPFVEVDIEERVEKLELLSKVGTLRTCGEYRAFGIRTSGEYTVDPDGIMIGEAPFNVYCNFDSIGEAVTEIFHNAEDLANVEHCQHPGCSSTNITYTSGPNGNAVSLNQLEALIALSATCEQAFFYSCTLAPLRDDGLDYAYWTGRDGEEKFYFTGSDPALHACDCYFTEEGCEEEELKRNTCNCDSNIPAPLNDTGLITNMEDLPIISIAFGGLTYDAEQAAYRIGRLSCRGERQYEKATSCESLKLSGETNSGYFTVKKTGSLHTTTVYCDMSQGGYSDVLETTQLSADAPLGTIVAWVPRNNVTADINTLHDGWLPCDGRIIEKGIWAGGVTPDLNTDGHFLRGATEENALEMEEDQIVDHEHIDPGHTHTNAPHSHRYEDEHDSFPGTSHGTSGDYYKWAAEYKDTAGETINIDTSYTNVGGVALDYNSGSETRPRNMKVMWIIKVW